MSCQIAGSPLSGCPQEKRTLAAPSFHPHAVPGRWMLHAQLVSHLQRTLPEAEFPLLLALGRGVALLAAAFSLSPYLRALREGSGNWGNASSLPGDCASWLPEPNDLLVQPGQVPRRRNPALRPCCPETNKGTKSSKLRIVSWTKQVGQTQCE